MFACLSMNIRLISIWKANKAPGTYVPFHNHKYHELVYYPFGKGTTAIGDTNYSFSAHSLAIIPPFALHDERHDENGCVICLVFDGDMELEKGIKKDAIGRVQALLESILSEAQEQKYGYEDMIRAHLCELAVHLLREEQKKGCEEKDFGYIINYMKENYHEKMVLGDCAAYLHLSYDYFHHRFKQITGFSPRRFLLLCRLHAAERLLTEEDIDCTEIAYRCGFSTSAQFSALFKREYGKTPLQYRKTKMKK